MPKKHIILIGMPGCGKSTLGKLLAQRLHCAFVDMDSIIVDSTKQSIAALFSQGEAVFRDAETAACRLLAAQPPCVIACGGGVVKREQNIGYLRTNGILLFIDRPIEQILTDIDTASRPLLAQGAKELYALYEERYPLYLRYADLRVDNTATAEQTVESLLQSLTEKEILP